VLRSNSDDELDGIDVGVEKAIKISRHPFAPIVSPRGNSEEDALPLE
jgi:hypothetical protein